MQIETAFDVLLVSDENALSTFYTFGLAEHGVACRTATVAQYRDGLDGAFDAVLLDVASAGEALRSLVSELAGAVPDGPILALPEMPEAGARFDSTLRTVQALRVGAPDATLIEKILPFVGHRLEEIEQAMIDATIRVAGSIPKAAAMLGISPSTIYRRQDGYRS